MPELTSILRARLEAGEEPKEHPDADILTAYAEGVLPSGERNQVLLHISLCNQCRDVLALIMPEGVIMEATEEEPGTMVAAGLPAPRRAWFRSPRFALAASLVAVAAGIMLVLEIPQPHRKAPVLTASVQQEPQPVAPAPVASDQGTAPSDQATASLARAAQEPAPAAVAPATVEPSSRVNDAQTRQPASAVPKKSVVTAQNQPQVVATAEPQDYLNNTVFGGRLSYAGAVSAPRPQELPQAPRAVRPPFAFSRQSGTSSTIQSNAFLEITPANGVDGSRGTTTIYTFATSERTSVGFGSRVAQLGTRFHLKRLAPAISAEKANSYAMFSPGLSGAAPAEITAKPLAKTPSGQVLAQSPAFTTRAMAHGMSAVDQSKNSFLWKINQGTLLKSSDMEHWMDGYPASEGIQFSVVTASGAEVWAGGKDAALVHSRDGGVTWERITLGASATGTISNIEVAGSSIRVRSSSGQGWLSQDGGQSWGLQN